MNTIVAAAGVERFREIVRRRLGLHLEDGTTMFLAEVLGGRLDEVGEDCATYLDRLASCPDGQEIGRLGSALTINETSFFRNIDQFDAIAEVVVPERISVRRERQHLRMLSVGCATGDEPYTLSMVVGDQLPGPQWTVSITAVDIDPMALRKARQGRYSQRALRSTPDDMRRRWFHADGDEMVLNDDIRRTVTFVEGNVANEDPRLWQTGHYDAILCRNMLMYLTADTYRAVLRRVARSLAPGGYLFLGHAEVLRSEPDSFEIRNTNNTFYYRRTAPQQPMPRGSGTS